MEIVRTRSGWGVSAEGHPAHLFEVRSKRACAQWREETLQIQARISEMQRQDTEAHAALLRRLDLEQVDYRDLEPGDAYTYDLAHALRVITRVNHLPSGASMIHFDNHADVGFRFMLHVGDDLAYRKVLRCQHCEERMQRRDRLWWHIDGKSGWVVCVSRDTRATPRRPQI